MCKCVTESRRFSLPKQSTWPCRRATGACAPKCICSVSSHMLHRFDIFDNPSTIEPTAQRHAWISASLNLLSCEYFLLRISTTRNTAVNLSAAVAEEFFFRSPDSRRRLRSPQMTVFFFSFPLLHFGRFYLPFTPRSREFWIHRQTWKFRNAREKRQFTLIWEKRKS